MNICNMTDGFTIIFVQFYSLGLQDLRHFSFVLDRQEHIFEKLILEITKVNIYSRHLHYKKG